MVVFGQKLFYSGKNGCIRAKGLVFRQMRLYSGKMVVFGKSGCIREKVVVFGQNGCIRAKVVVFWQEWLYSSKKGCTR